MDNYITGATIKRLREAKGITQTQLAEQIGVSSKAVSKWETARGIPDISLIEPLSRALGVSIIELMSGDTVINRNISCNISRSNFMVCPICGNSISSTGDAVISCCGLTLSPLEAEAPDENHRAIIEKVEDEHFITVKHDMTKEHYISFAAYVKSDKVYLVRLYPEQSPSFRLPMIRGGKLYLYCIKHGLMLCKSKL